MENKKPNVATFEAAVAAKEYEKACIELLSILTQLDTNFGTLDNIDFNFPQQLNEMEQEKTVYFCTRMATAITTLFTDPALEISTNGGLRFFTLQRWLSFIFASSPFINADHILQTYNRNPDPTDPFDIHLGDDESSLIKFGIFYLPETNVNVNLDALWSLNPNICASLCFALQSPRFIGTPAAFNKRGVILQWFPEKLAQLSDLDSLPSGISHDVYMHCSYDIATNKHLVKKALNQVIRRYLQNCYHWEDRDVSQIGYRDGKPVMVVLLEHFHSAHSIYRTHSTSMVAAREHFYLIGLGSSAVDEKGRAVFDEFHEVTGKNMKEKLSFVRKICEESQVAIFYMPSIGMDLTTIFASNTRLAPIQVVALGHPATTHSDFIEYVIVEDDYVGSEECFSETLLRLPKDALPYVPSSLAPTNVEYRLRENPEVVNIGIASTTMKLNPYFLEALKTIRDRAKVKVHFHFALGQSNGITHPYVERFIKSYLGDSATAYPHSPYQQYLETLYQCDMMLNPFPFGNTNGIIDMVTLGLVGVCKTGPEVHEHIDEGLFKRLGLPEWLITRTADEYVDCAVRLIENYEERLALRRHIIENNGLQTLFTGDPRPMGQILLAKLNEWQESNSAKTAKQAVKKVKKVAKPATEKKSTAAAKKSSATAKKAKTASASSDKPLKNAVKKLKKEK